MSWVGLLAPGRTPREIINKLQDLYFHHTPFASQQQVVLVDHNNAFTGPNRLIPYLQTMVDDGMLKPECLKMIKVVKTPEEVPATLMDPTVPWTTPQQSEKYVVDQRKLTYFA